MKKQFSCLSIFIYQESCSFFLSSSLGSLKLKFLYTRKLLVLVSKCFFYITFSTFCKDPLKITVISFLNIVGSCISSLWIGFAVKFSGKGKRVRLFYDNMLFFFKLGYNRRINYLLPFDVYSFKKKKKKKYYSLVGIQHNSLSSTAHQISIFRTVDPYNFGGLIFREGHFKYSSWNSKM